MAALYLVTFVLVFCGLLWHTNGVCNITCTTDYISTLNCSCLGSEEPTKCDIQAECSDGYDSTVGNCVISPPQKWCIMKMDEFIAEADTVCTLQVKQFNQKLDLKLNTSHTFYLYYIIKPQQPANLTVQKMNKEFNISWAMVYTEDEHIALNGELKYRVRLRPKNDINEKHFKTYIVRDDRRYQEVQCEVLQPGVTYVADVQASVNYQKESEEYWSEWSTSPEWFCPFPDDADDPCNSFGLMNSVLLITAVILAVMFLLFGMVKCCKKLGLSPYIPNPEDFFKPLYHTYQGDFKKWVGPVITFSSFDMLEKSAPLQVLGEKQQAAVPSQRELLLDPKNGNSGPGDWSLLSWMNADLTKRYFLGSSSLGLVHSGGHISMDTVTVSGQEGAMSDFLEIDPNADDAGNDDDPTAERRASIQRQGFDEWSLHADIMANPEEISLESYDSNEPSDDGYPQIGLDLDTIDSGFLESECSSPISSDCDGGNRMDAALIDDTVGAHSNYVKQWVAFIPPSGDSSSSVK